MSRGSSQTLPFAPGAVLQGRYRLLRIVGHGRTAIVYAADDRRLELRAEAVPRLAIKVLRPELVDDRAERNALKIEGETLLALRHRYIPRLEDSGSVEGLPFLVMEMIPGRGLDHGSRRSRRPISPIGIGHLLGGAAEALAFMHHRGFVHADVKPGNLLCGDDGVARLIDFGTARPTGWVPSGGSGAAPDRIVTPAYASPQLMRGEPPMPADDTYGLAVVAYELMAGQPPFAGRPPLPGEIPIRPAGVGRSGWSWLKDALAADRTARPDDPCGLAVALLADFPIVRLLRRFSSWRG
ncbi:serine/threonine-protein kinase [Inquilinus sp. CA228]|uniref:serine/threonine-protein kinase n=1 Tax=Inquilinus sp. CA228 TaxID=3455609 RepID=UPI003F8D1827